jgi:hypothetical protein
MGSIPPKKPSEIARDVAVTVAFELRRPWRVGQLQEEASRAYLEAERRAGSLGLPPKQADELILGLIYEQVKEAGERMDRLTPGQSKPRPEHIEAALRAFSIEQWICLIDGLDQTGTRALLSYIRQHADDLKQMLGARKVERIEGRAIMRDTEVWLAENRSTLVPISDPYWAALWRELARQANREGRRLPASERSVIEQASDRNIAERLSKVDGLTGREMKAPRTRSGSGVSVWRSSLLRSSPLTWGPTTMRSGPPLSSTG